MSGPIRTVLVVGGGIVGWSAAAALKRKLPSFEVTILPLDPPADALADRMCGTLPSIFGFHQDMGLTDVDTVTRAGSAMRAGTLFEGWSHRPYVHSFGSVGEPFRGAPFHQLWLRSAANGSALPFDHYSPAARAAREGQLPRDGAHGLHLTMPRYCAMMSAFAQHLGVKLVDRRFGGIRQREDGGVAAISLTDADELTADLFVDATGPRALLRAAVGAAFQPWDEWLVADRLLVQEGSPHPETSLLDRNHVEDDGWSWRASSTYRESRGRVTASAHQACVSDEDRETIDIRQGRLEAPWFRNCVAIGDAAVAVEPLEWSNLHLAHSAIDRLVSMMPDRECAPVEIAEYNRQCGEEADRIRDFLCLHYTAGPDRGAFWRDASDRDLPPSLAHTLALFRDRGRLPFYEEETFDKNSWLTVLLCQGVLPRGPGPLADAVDVREGEAWLRRLADLAAVRPRASNPAFKSIAESDRIR